MSEQFSQIPPIEMVCDAMRQAIVKQIFTGVIFHRDILHQSAPEIHNSDLKQYIHQSTEKNCTFGSREVLLYLQTKYAGLFTLLFLFRTKCQSWFWPGWNQHTYFMAQDITSHWYSGSPANLTAKDTFGVGEFYNAPSIELLLSRMKQNPSRMRMPQGFLVQAQLNKIASHIPNPVFSVQGNQNMASVGLIEYQKGKVVVDFHEWRVKSHSNFLPTYLREYMRKRV